jgi:hypothetical protein
LETVFMPWVRNVLQNCAAVFKPEAGVIEQRLLALSKLVQGGQREELLYCGREMLEHIEVVVSGAVLMLDATVNPGEVAQELARRWVRSTALTPELGLSRRAWQETARLDRSIFLGDLEAGMQRPGKL